MALQDQIERLRRIAAERQEAPNRPPIERGGVPRTPRTSSRGVPQVDRVFELVQQRTVPMTPVLEILVRGLRWRADRAKRCGAPAGALLAVSGDPGTGKTCGASWIVAWREASSCFVRAEEVGRTAQTAHQQSTAAWDQWLAPSLLVIDECGAEHTAGAAARITSLWVQRYDAGKATVLLTNIASGPFVQRFCSARNAAGSYVVDRRVLSRLGNEQDPDRGGFAWWWDVPSYDLRDYETREKVLPTLAPLTERDLVGL